MELSPAPAQLTAQRIRTCAAIVLFLAAGVVFLNLKARIIWAALCALACLLLCMVFLPLRHRSYAYSIMPESICVKSGILQRSYFKTPVSAIQYVSVSQSPLQRILGIALLRLHMAGGNVDLRGILLSQAYEIANLISSFGGGV